MTDDGKVEVGGNLYEADQILIATGGHAVIPDTPGAEHGITSDGFFDLKDLPKYFSIFFSSSALHSSWNTFYKLQIIIIFRFDKYDCNTIFLMKNIGFNI